MSWFYCQTSLLSSKLIQRKVSCLGTNFKTTLIYPHCFVPDIFLLANILMLHLFDQCVSCGWREAGSNREKYDLCSWRQWQNIAPTSFQLEWPMLVFKFLAFIALQSPPSSICMDWWHDCHERRGRWKRKTFICLQMEGLSQRCKRHLLHETLSGCIVVCKASRKVLVLQCNQ